MTHIHKILQDKGSEVFTIAPTATVFEAVRHMVDSNVGALVVQQGHEIVGIITERDYLRQIVVKDRSSRDTPVSDIMSTQVICVEPEDSVPFCMAIMTEKHFRHLPVVDQGRLCGIVSVGDLIKRQSRDQEIHIHYLSDYISDRYPG